MTNIDINREIVETMTAREVRIRACAADVQRAGVLSPEWRLVPWVERHDVGPRWTHLFGGGDIAMVVPGIRQDIPAGDLYRVTATCGGGAHTFTGEGHTAVGALRDAVGNLFTFVGRESDS